MIAAIITERNTLRQDTSGVIFKDIRNCRRFFMYRKFFAISLFQGNPEICVLNCEGKCDIFVTMLKEFAALYIVCAIDLN